MKEKRVTQKPAVPHATPVPESQTRSVERDTLNDTPELRFLRDEIEALLGSPTVRRATQGPAISYASDHAPSEAAAAPGDPRDVMPADEIADEDTAEFDGSAYARDTEPSIDVQRLRDAARGAGKP
jgi:hypothetical protein